MCFVRPAPTNIALIRSECNIDCMCLRSCTVIYHELRIFFWLMFWKIVNHQQCRSKLVALQKESLLSCHRMHRTMRDSRGFSLSFKHAHDSILLTPKKKNNCSSAFPILSKEKKHNNLLFLFCSSQFHLTKMYPCNKSGHVVYSSVTWPFPVISTACIIFSEWLSLMTHTWTKAHPVFAAMKLSPVKVQTEKVKPHLLTTSRI